jgi:hypothetical protein
MSSRSSPGIFPLAVDKGLGASSEAMDIPELQEALRAVPGVTGTTIRWPDPAEPLKVRIEFEPGAGSGRVAHTALELIRQSEIVDFDVLEVQCVPSAGRARRSVSLPQTEVVESLGNGHDPLVWRRPAFVNLNAVDGALESSVEVILDMEGRQISGRAGGLSTPGSELRIAAVATLNALQNIVPDTVRFEFEWAQVSRAGEELVQVGVAYLTSTSGPRRLYGSAAVVTDRRVAAARATLDALNRQLALLAVPA